MGLSVFGKASLVVVLFGLVIINNGKSGGGGIEAAPFLFPEVRDHPDGVKVENEQPSGSGTDTLAKITAGTGFKVKWLGIKEEASQMTKRAAEIWEQVKQHLRDGGKKSIESLSEVEEITNKIIEVIQDKREFDPTHPFADKYGFAPAKNAFGTHRREVAILILVIIPLAIVICCIVGCCFACSGKRDAPVSKVLRRTDVA